MSVCQYYKRGFCRYGDRCHFLHEDASASNPPARHHPSSVRFPPRAQIDSKYHYVASNTNKANHLPTASQILKALSDQPDVYRWIAESFTNTDKAIATIDVLWREAQQLQKSEHFWRFTSKSLFCGGLKFDDWIDQSFEEIRWLHQQMACANKEHIFKKEYSTYWEKNQRQLIELSRLDLNRLKSIQRHLSEYIASAYQPSPTLATDVEMKDANSYEISTASYWPQMQTATQIPVSHLSAMPTAALESGTFEFGQIPTHVPPEDFC